MLQKETVKAEKELKKPRGKKFACVPDAENEAKIWASKLPYHDLMDIQIIPATEKVEKRRGWPKKNEQINQCFKIKGRIEINEDVLAEESKRFNRFILASNDVNLDPELSSNIIKDSKRLNTDFDS